MDIEKKLLGLLKDAAVLVHKYYYETNMPLKDTCMIVQLLAENYANNIDELPEDEYSLKKEVEEQISAKKKEVPSITKQEVIE
jgi:hypothetical protein